MTEIFDNAIDASPAFDAEKPAEKHAEKPRPKRRSGSSTRRSSRTPKPPVRKVAEKAEQIAGADEIVREQIAELMSAPSAGIADLTTAIMEAKKNPLDSAVADLRVIQEGTLPEATIHLVGMDRDALASLVRVGELFGAVDLPERIPARSTDAALVLIEPMRGVDVDHEHLNLLMELLAP